MNCFNTNLRAKESGHLLWRVAGLIGLLVLLVMPRRGVGGEVPALTEYQVKALFLLNFTKYVEWPPEVFAQADSPITIGVLGNNKFNGDLKTTVAGKTINGRAIIVQPIVNDEDCAKCCILFMSASEKKRLPEVLERLKGLPILTVGETEQFNQQGGIINFTKKEGKIRLEIDLSASHSAKLRISSQLLKVADTVRGKP